ncbi:hypothetical protein BGZ99_001048 [Dissophora globulifera]|uniref:Transmembrane protein n=1 Tax=Dissophora globulifera TaxID=979702 RepID=A0A9P6QZS1_9FUNG|nr:hypothetical protein BGZ99_001048 [Dissophora globulifera]
MAQRPVLHALFHSVATLGYIPFALTSVLISSSSPFVSIPPIGVILIAFVPPLTAFPVLCFSYRYLERFECISLTVQRARTYVMLAGCGLCFLVAAHLMMVHLLANAHNTTYHPLTQTFTPIQPLPQLQLQQQQPPVQQIQQPIHMTAITATSATPIVANIGSATAGNGQEATDRSGQDPRVSNMLPLAISDSLEEALAETQTWPIPFTTSFLLHLPLQEAEAHEQQQEEEDEEQEEDAIVDNSGIAVAASRLSKRSRDSAAIDNAPMFKTLVPMHLLNHSKDGGSSAVGELKTSDSDDHAAIHPQQEQRDMSSQQPFLPGEQPQQQPAVSSSDGTVISDTPSIPAKTVTTGENGAPPPQLEGESNNGNTANSTEQGSRGDASIHFSDPEAMAILSPGYYDLQVLHWTLYIGAQGFLVFLLIMLFLGVLVLTEYVLDREDEDFAQLQYLYWARVVGIASATIVSAVHGSLLSGYVLLDGQSDWIAKAAVGAICMYWVTMTSVMSKVVGPLPY